MEYNERFKGGIKKHTHLRVASNAKRQTTQWNTIKDLKMTVFLRFKNLMRMLFEIPQMIIPQPLSNSK